MKAGEQQGLPVTGNDEGRLLLQGRLRQGGVSLGWKRATEVKESALTSILA